MYTLLILLLLGNAFYTGVRRGLVLQLVYTGGYFISYIVARLSYQSLGEKLSLLIPYPSANLDSKFVFFDQSLGLELDKAFYAGAAFLLILFLGSLLTKFIGIFLHRLTFFPVAKQVNTLVGGVLSLLVVYIGIFLVLFILSLIPLEGIQNIFRSSGLARFMVEDTPILSKQIYQWWVKLIV